MELGSSNLPLRSLDGHHYKGRGRRHTERHPTLLIASSLSSYLIFHSAHAQWCHSSKDFVSPESSNEKMTASTTVVGGFLTTVEGLWGRGPISISNWQSANLGLHLPDSYRNLQIAQRCSASYRSCQFQNSEVMADCRKMPTSCGCDARLAVPMADWPGLIGYTAQLSQGDTAYTAWPVRKSNWSKCMVQFVVHWDWCLGRAIHEIKDQELAQVSIADDSTGTEGVQQPFCRSWRLFPAFLWTFFEL